MVAAGSGLPFLSAQEVRAQITPDRARELIAQALREGFDPTSDPSRVNVPAGAGHLLLMPSTLGHRVGVKVASVAPGNPAQGLPRIQALYLLLDAATLTPLLTVEGSVLTALRTPATTAVACDALADPDAQSLVVFGNGPQAVEHVVALRGIRPIQTVTIVGRTSARAQVAVSALAEREIEARAGEPEAVRDADIVVCATSAGEPVFDGALVRDGACVAAIGSHEPDRRELPADLLARSVVVVEDIDTALREAGDIVLALEEGALDMTEVGVLADLVRGTFARREDRPNVFKGTGMSWQDLAVAGGLDIGPA